MREFFSDISNLAFDTLFPLKCFSCGNAEGTIFCESCLTEATKTDSQMCIVCRGPSVLGATHPGCKTGTVPDGLITSFNYKSKGISQSIIAGKYKFIPKVFSTLGNFGALELRKKEINLFFEDFLVTPLPLGKWRKRWRGFNQSEIIGQALSETLNLPFEQILLRNRETKTQKDLNHVERIKNIKNCFQIKKELGVKNKNILLVDDVATTGFTLMEGARVLKMAGAKKVWCYALAQD